MGVADMFWSLVGFISLLHVTTSVRIKIACHRVSPKLYIDRGLLLRCQSTLHMLSLWKMLIIFFFMTWIHNALVVSSWEEVSFHSHDQACIPWEKGPYTHQRDLSRC